MANDTLDNYEDLVAQFIEDGGKVTKCIPANGGNNEIHPVTREHIAKTRKEWREKNK